MLDTINSAPDLKDSDLRSSQPSAEAVNRFARILEVQERQSTLHAAAANAGPVPQFIVAADRTGEVKVNMAELASTRNLSREDVLALAADARLPVHKVAADSHAFSPALETLKGAVRPREPGDRRRP